MSVNFPLNSPLYTTFPLFTPLFPIFLQNPPTLLHLFLAEKNPAYEGRVGSGGI
jgi:hypothetical protein